MVTSLTPNSLVVFRTRTWICILIGNLKAGFTLGNIYSAKAGGAEHKTATNNSNKHNRVKNLNRPEANHLASHKRDREFEVMQDYQEQIQLAVRARLELWAGGPSL